MTAVERLDAYINALNRKAVETPEYPLRYSYKIGKFAKILTLGNSPEELEDLAKRGMPQSTKLFRTIRVYVSSTVDNSRTHIYENHYVAKTAAEFLRVDYSEKLADEFLYLAFQNITIALANKAINDNTTQDEESDESDSTEKIGATLTVK